MIVWNQLTGNNVVTTGSQTPAYNIRNGFNPGPQNDIFEGAASAPPASSSSSASISISVTPTAVTHVQSPTTMSTVVKPASTSTTSAPANAPSSVDATSLPASVVPTTAVNEGGPATVTVTVTATPTHSGHHYTDCWVDGEADD